MNILAVDTAGKTAGVALLQDAITFKVQWSKFKVTKD